MALFQLETTLSTPVGSGIFTVFAVLTIFSLVLSLLRHYLPLRTTPAYVTFPVFLALALPASAILLVPLDLASSPPDSSSPSGLWLSQRVMLVSWRIVYWLTFVFTWIVLPFLGEYLDSGYRTPKDRMMYSIRSNGRYQLFVLSAGLLGLIYIIIQNRLDFTSLKSLIMALAYVWGLVLAIYLMGHGFVGIPRTLWLNMNTGARLRRVQARAIIIHDRLTDSVSNLEGVKSQVNQLQRRKGSTSPDMQDWIEELADAAGIHESRFPQSVERDDPINHVPDVITERYLANLTRSLHRAKHQNARFMNAWDRLVQEASDCQAIINSSASKSLELTHPNSRFSMVSRLPFITPYIRYHIFVHVLPVMRAVLAVVFASASVCVVWSELTKTFAPSLSVIGISVTKVHSTSGQVGFFGQVIASMWILYMCSAAFVGVSQVKVWGNRALVPRNTYGESACWYAGQIAKLTVPLAYNFITFLPRDAKKRTTFYHFLGQYINLTPLGKGFDYFFPIFILIPIFATTFNLYGKIKNIFGFGFMDRLDDEDDLENNPTGFGIGGWREGRALIDQELNGPGFLGLSSRSAADIISSTTPAPISGPTSTGSASRSNNNNNNNNTNSIRATPRSRTNAWTPSVQNSGAAATGQDHSRLNRTRTAPPRRVVEEGDDDGDENFFQSFAHRVKNTIETTNKPKWLQDVDAGFKRPRWMGGSDDDDDVIGTGTGTGVSGSSHTGGNNSGIGRWFGGQSPDGRLRL